MGPAPVRDAIGDREEPLQAEEPHCALLGFSSHTHTTHPLNTQAAPLVATDQMHARTHARTSARMHTHAHTHTHTHLSTCTHTHAYTVVRTHTDTQAHGEPHADTSTHTHAHTFPRRPAHRQAHAHTHTQFEPLCYSIRHHRLCELMHVSHG